jgi:hypothetical protein
MTQDLYIIEAKSDLLNTDDCIVKIGISSHAINRKKDIQVGSFCDLKIIYRTRVKGNARTVEANAHEMLNQYKLKGEWFKIPKQHLRQVKQMCDVLIEVEQKDKIEKQTKRALLIKEKPNKTEENYYGHMPKLVKEYQSIATTEKPKSSPKRKRKRRRIKTN